MARQAGVPNGREETTMVPHPNNIMLLADIRNREVRNEIAHLRLLREAQAADHTPHAATAMACRRLGASFARVRLRMELFTWAPASHRRGAFSS